MLKLVPFMFFWFMFYVEIHPFVLKRVPIYAKTCTHHCYETTLRFTLKFIVIYVILVHVLR
jgi:hypothetical protein